MTPVSNNGVYDFDETGNPTFKGAADVLRAGAYNPDELQRLLALTWQAQRSPSLREGFTTEANNISPGLGDRLEAYFKSRQFTIAALAVIIAAIALIAPYLKDDETEKPATKNVYNTTVIAQPQPQKTEAAKPPVLQKTKPKNSSNSRSSNKARKRRRK